MSSPAQAAVVPHWRPRPRASRLPSDACDLDYVKEIVLADVLLWHLPGRSEVKRCQTPCRECFWEVMTEDLLELFCSSAPLLLLSHQQTDRLKEGRRLQWSYFFLFVHQFNLCLYCLLADLFACCLQSCCRLSRIL